MSDKTFANGLIVKAPREGAPEFVKATLSIKTEEFVAFLEAHTKADGWCNIDVKESRGGKWYAELNSWTKGGKVEAVEPTTDEPDPSQIPF